MNSKKVYWILGIIVLALIIGGYVFFGSKKNLDLKTTNLSINGINFKVQIAETMLARSQGLSGRESLGTDEGLLFLFGTSGMYPFWMKDMKFPIDIIWISGKTIAGFAESVNPEPEKTIFSLTSYSPPQPVDTVLEINAGLVKQYGFQIGDQVAF